MNGWSWLDPLSLEARPRDPWCGEEKDEWTVARARDKDHENNMQIVGRG